MLPPRRDRYSCQALSRFLKSFLYFITDTLKCKGMHVNFGAKKTHTFGNFSTPKPNFVMAPHHIPPYFYVFFAIFLAISAFFIDKAGVCLV